MGRMGPILFMLLLAYGGYQLFLNWNDRNDRKVMTRALNEVFEQSSMPTGILPFELDTRRQKILKDFTPDAQISILMDGFRPYRGDISDLTRAFEALARDYSPLTAKPYGLNFPPGHFEKSAHLSAEASGNFRGEAAPASFTLEVDWEKNADGDWRIKTLTLDNRKNKT